MHRISASTLQQSYQTRTTHQRSVCRWDWGCHAIYSALPILHISIIFVIFGRPWVECAQLMAGHFVELHGNTGWTPGSDAWYSGSERGLDICSSCIWDDGWWVARCDASIYQEPEVERKRQNLIMESVWIPGHEQFQPRELSSHHGQSYDVGWNIIWGAKQSSVEGDWGHCTGKRSFLDIDSSELSFLAVRDKDRILQLLSESTGNILDDEARLLWLLINSSSFGHVCILHKSTLQCWRAFWRSSSIPLPPQRQCCPKMLSENTTLLFSAKSKCPFTLCSRGISQNRRACCRAGRARKKQQSEGQCIVCKILQDSTMAEIKSKHFPTFNRKGLFVLSMWSSAIVPKQLFITGKDPSSSARNPRNICAKLSWHRLCRHCCQTMLNRIHPRLLRHQTF